MSKLTPLRAIRKRCYGCGEGTAKTIRDCEFPNCALYPLRFGKRVQGIKSAKAIREYCLWCCGNPNEVRLCVNDGKQSTLCPLYPYRFGKNPTKKGNLKNLERYYFKAKGVNQKGRA